MNNSTTTVTIENFDDSWGLLCDPVKVEVMLTQLLPAALATPDRSIYPQILSQIALSQGMQRKFSEAHATLDKAEAALTRDCEIAKVRICLDRGKVFQQSEHVSNARDCFVQSYNLSTKYGFDSYAIDAAHMIAIISEDSVDKIRWNELAIELANRTDNLQARRWLGSLYNNLGRNYLEASRFEEALDAFTRTLSYRQDEGLIINIRIANWAIACALRGLGRYDEALEILLSLFDEYEALRKCGNLGMPVEMFDTLRGFVCDELAELYYAKLEKAKSIYFARLAFEDISKSKDPIFVKSVAKRLIRLTQIRDQSQ